MSPSPPDGVRAAVGLALSGRYREPALQAAHGLEVWASEAGLALTIHDTSDDLARIEATYRALAGDTDLLFGPYGSGPLRAAQRAIAGMPDVLWNHGGAAGGDRGSMRVVDVLGPAESYWAGLPIVVEQRGLDATRVVLAHSPTGFGERTAAGARQALATLGAEPAAVVVFDVRSAQQVVDQLPKDVSLVIACGRIEDDLALLSAIGLGGPEVGAIVAGVDLARVHLGDAVVGRFGPAQWFPDQAHPLGDSAEYPAAQAYAAGQVASAAFREAGGVDPESLWRAALDLRMHTLIGPFRVDADGRQRAHRPLLVEWVATPEGPRRRTIWRP